MTNYYLDNATSNLKDNPSKLVLELIKKKLSKDEIQRLLDTHLNSEDVSNPTTFFSNLLHYVNVFMQMGNQLYENLPSDSTIPVMIQMASESLNAEKAAIFLNDSETKELVTRTAQGEWIPIRIPNDWGIIGSVFSSGKTEIVNNLNIDARFGSQSDPRSGRNIKNIIAVPLKTRSEKIIGVLEVSNKEDGEFTQQDASLLEAIAAQAAVALRNGELHRQIKLAYSEEKKILNIGQQLTSELQLMPLINKILNITVDLLNADRSSLFLHDPQTNELWALDGKGDISKKIRFPSDKGVAGAVFKSARGINIADAYSDSRFNPEFDQKIGYHTQTILCIPLMSSNGEKCIGVIQAINKKGGAFSLTDEKRLEVLGEHASIAIENAKLYKG